MSSERLQQDIAPHREEAFFPPVPYPEARQRAESLVGAMTREERFSLVCGQQFATAPLPGHHIPAYRMSDASQGLRLMEDQPLPQPLAQTTAFPCTLLLAATWNRRAAARYAQSLGEECRAGGVNILLGPGMNIYRIAQCGRNFEYLGEDPFLAAALVRPYVTALQRTGTMATLKHFVCNNTDWHRRVSNSQVDARALREMYLPAFQAGIEAGALATMTSYNQLNGEYCGQSHHVITELLRQELGFQGLVMTDWDSVTDGEELAASGQDLEMPEGRCLTAAREALWGSPQVDRMASSILAAAIAMGWQDQPPEPTIGEEMWEAHRQVAYEVACQGMVLLRNEGILPLPPRDHQLLLTGNWARRDRLCGDGSGFVEGYDRLSYLEAIAHRVGTDQVRYAAQPTESQLTEADTVLVCTGFEQEGEGADRSFRLPNAQEELVRRCCAANGRTVVLITAGGGIAMDWERETAAIVHAFYGGQCGGKAAAAILFGEVNPSGKLPFSVEKDFADSPGADYLPAPGPEVLAAAHPETLAGRQGPPTVPGSWPYSIAYEEGIFVGYRWYAAHQKPVRYWFGHGLSYTTFTLDALQVEQQGTSLPLTVECRVTNSGTRAGAEVVQLYVEDVDCSLPRPPRELKGFERVMLEPGESRQVAFTLGPRELSFYHPSQARWLLEPGLFRLHLGHSYADIALEGEVEVTP